MMIFRVIINDDASRLITEIKGDYTDFVSRLITQIKRDYTAPKAFGVGAVCAVDKLRHRGVQVLGSLGMGMRIDLGRDFRNLRLGGGRFLA